jgi:hypothetical protein
MTFKTLGAVLENDFLFLRYTHCGFIINKNEIHKSFVLNDTKNISGKLPYFNALFSHEQEKIPLLDLDAYFLDTFGSLPLERDNNYLILLCDIDRFQPKNRRNLLFSYQKFKVSSFLSSRYLALKVSKNIELKRCPLSSLKPLPLNLRSFSNNHGILGFFFDEESALPYYFIDIEKIIFRFLLQPSQNSDNEG